MTIGDFNRIYTMHNPCIEGVEQFRQCRNHRDVIDLAMSPQGLDFLLDSISDGWGPSPSDMKDAFKPYINGKYTSKYRTEGGRTICSQMWCDAKEITISDEIRRIAVIGCHGSIRIDDWQIVKIFIDANSNVDIYAPSNSIVYVENAGGAFRDCNFTCKIIKRNDNGL